MRVLLAFALLLIAAPIAATHWWEEGPPLPRLNGRVVDDAGLLSPAQQRDLSARLARLETVTGHQFVIITLPSLHGQTIEHLGLRLGRTWGIGRKGVGDGVLLIVAPNERRVRIEVGNGLEKTLHDSVCAKIIRETIAPRFGRGDMAGGIRAGATAIVSILGNKRS